MAALAAGVKSANHGISGSDIYSVMDTAGRAVGTAICGHNRWSRDR